MMLPTKVRKGPCFGIVLVISLCLLVITTIWPVSTVPNQQLAIQSTSENTENDDFNDLQPPESFNEGIPFRHFNSELTYQTEGVAGRALTQHEETQLTAVRTAGIDYLKTLRKGNVFADGRYRWLPEGVEYDLSFRDPTKSVTNRVTIFQKLEPPKVIRSLESSHSTVVHIIISLQGRLDKYAIFVDHLASNIFPEDPHVTLTVVYFSDDDVKEARDITRQAMSSVPSARWSFIPLEDANFSRGRGLHVGAESKRVSENYPAEILFFCDVDILMQPDFFGRCRSNSIRGQQVYYPVVFSLYNPKLVYPLFDKDVPGTAEQLQVTEQSGFWRVFGFGMTCMYMSDYEAAGGFPDIRTWGGEDEALYEKFLHLDDIKVLRSPDPSLFHLYHRKHCPDITSTSYPACLKSKALTEGSQLQLGLTLLKLHEGTDLEGVLTKRFYYFWMVPYLAGFLLLSLATNVLLAVANLSHRRSLGTSKGANEKRHV